MTIRISTPVTVLPRFGFVPVKVDVDNGSARNGTWQVRFEAGNPETSVGAIDSRMEISAAAGKSHEAWFYVPLSDAAPGFTLGTAPSPPRGNRFIMMRAPTAATTAASASVAGVESRAQSKLRGAGLLPSGTRLQWTTRLERGDRPGESIGIATASLSISAGETEPSGEKLPLGIDIDDGIDPVTSWNLRRFIYKETVPDPAGAAPPKSSVWSDLSSSLTAEATARRALESSGLLQLSEGVTQTVQVSPLESGVVGGQVAWLTTFVQTGSPRVLPLQTGLSVPAGAVVNLHASGRQGEVIRTVTFVEPASLASLEKQGDNMAEADAAAADARNMLMRYGFLRPQPEVTISRTFPGRPDYKGTAAQEGAIFWFETGPARQLSDPLFGSLPPDTSAYVLPGPTPDQVVRVFAVGPRNQSTVASTSGTAKAGPNSEFTMLVTGPGIVGAASVSFTGLLPSLPTLAPPLAVSQPLAADFRQTLLNGNMRGTPNLSPVDTGSLEADWRFWSPYHAVFLRLSEYQAMAPDVQAALRDWILQGGLLYLQPTVPPGEEETPLTPRVPLVQDRVGMGMITYLSWTLDDYLAPPQINADGTAYVKPAEPATLIGLLQLNSLALSLPAGDSLHPRPHSPDLLASEPMGSGKWAALILAGFAILAGPVNLFRLAPSGRRHRLFVTTPILALTFAGALAITIIWWDGFGGSGDRTAVVALFPEEGSAVVYQDQIARTGVLASRNFDLSDQTLVANLPVDEYDATGRTSYLNRDDGVASGDWFRNHWGTAQHLREVVPTDSRVEIESNGQAAPTVRSTIPVALKSFIYVDSFSQLWFAPEVDPETPVTLTLSSINQWLPFDIGGSQYLQNVLMAAAQLEPNRWIAQAGASRIAPIPTLKSITWNDEVVYTGVASAGTGGGQ